MHKTGSIQSLLIASLLASAVASVGEGDERQSLVAVDGETVTATIEEVLLDWSIAVNIEGHQKTFEMSDYVRWGRYSDQDRSSQILLADGTVVVGGVMRIDTDSLTIASSLWGELRIDRGLVRGWMMLPAIDPLERDRQQNSLLIPETADRVVLQNGDVIAGTLLPTTERDGGGLFGLVSVAIKSLNGETDTPVQLEEVRAITFKATDVGISNHTGSLGFRDGSFVAAAAMAKEEPDETVITTVFGASLRLSSESFVNNLTFIQPQHERGTYLSDLPAVGYKSIPFLTLDWPLGIDTNTLGGRLRSGGHVIFKGLGMHSTSRVVYDLGGKYRRLETELALDDHAQRQGSVVYRVLLESEGNSGERSWGLAFTSPIIRGGDSPLPISVDVASASRMALVVEMADQADTRDYANWLNARLLP